MNRRRNSRGQSMVEFALILPIFVLLLVGIFDVGRAIYAYNTINNAARQGARLAIVDQTVGHIRERAASQAVSLDISPTDVLVDFRELDAPEVVGSCTGTKVGCLAVVNVPFAYQPATPLIGNILGTIDLAGESRFRVEFSCDGPDCPLGD